MSSAASFKEGTCICSVAGADDNASWITYASDIRMDESGPRALSPEGRLPAMDPVMLSPLIALIAGVLILLMPRVLNYVVAFYLIFIGIIGLLPQFQ